MAKAAKSKRASPDGQSASSPSASPSSNRERPPEPTRFAASREQLLEFYRQMLLIRRFEERAGQL
ncbi:MAG TPA: pyruvate dehydrogenase (acetyl-transferring) E1 component subunit alpha, partial [Allosphingosinicella sp.]